MIIERDKSQPPGVTQLQYVSDVELDVSVAPYMGALKDGLLIMGVSTLLGFSTSTSRWLGVIAVGLRLAK